MGEEKESRTEMEKSGVVVGRSEREKHGGQR